MTTWYTSDHHHFHKRITEITERGQFTDAENHTKWLIDLWNSQVKPSDTVWHLGDFNFSSRFEDWANVLRKLNGNINLIKGNHDDMKVMKSAQLSGLVNSVQDYKEVKTNGNTIVLFHFPIQSWNKQGYGSLHLHGHCVDDATEILTKNGWKFRPDLKVNDKILSYNIEKDCIEDDCVLDIIDQEYTGCVIKGDGKSYDFRVTEDHTMVTCDPSKQTVKKRTAGEFSESKFGGIVLNSIQKKEGVDLDVNLLKLYILIAADGNIKNETSLCRIVVKKQHKIDYIHGILMSLNLKYKTYLNSAGMTSFNFYLPDVLLKFKFKGLDSFILDLNKEQADAVFEAYSNSDGYLSGKTLVIYSAKEVEIDLLQAMFAQNGYMTNKYSRYHGFGTNLQHQLSVTFKQRIRVKPSTFEKEYVVNEHFWCIKSNNQTWIMRRNGVVQVTGNCHGSLPDTGGKRLDVGLDNAWNIFGKHQFFSEEFVLEYMLQRDVKVQDHHKDHTKEPK